MRWQPLKPLNSNKYSPKRLADTILAAILVILFSPFLLILPILIRITSPGPVLFRSQRLGMDGKPYTLLKFRSMQVGAQRIATHENVTIIRNDDARLTPIGRVLRLGFDELPQLFSVLSGKMSLIGPRPDEPEDLAHYDDLARRRMDVRPGISGLAAICGSRKLSAKERYILDAHYVNHLSLSLDLWILVNTLLYIVGLRSPGVRRREKILQESQ